MNREMYSGGSFLGAIFAAILSYAKWHSVGWAIVHGFFGWLYVIYYFLEHGIPS